MKKILCVLLAAVICLAAAPLQDFSGLDLSVTASAATEGYYTYEIKNGEATITAVDKSSIKGDISIPSTLGGYPVTKIGDYVFSSCQNLTSVTIPKSVTSIGKGAFQSCRNLKSITVSSENTAYSSDSRGVLFNKDKTVLIQYPLGNTAASYSIPNSVKTIGYYSFGHCTLKSITIPNGVTTIERTAFYYCEYLTDVTIPKSVTSIGETAFFGCSKLTSITISENVTNIGLWAFNNCLNLKSITVASENTAYSSDSRGVLFNKDKTVLIQYPSGNTEKVYSIPNSVTTIERNALSYCNFTKVTIPDSITIISENAFSYCTNLTSVIISESVTRIDYGAFHYCLSLTSITIPKSVQYIGYNSFSHCENLTHIYVDEENPRYTSDSNGVLFNKNKTEIVSYPCGKTDAYYYIPDGVKEIAQGAFNGSNNLKSIDFSDNVTYIGSSAFSFCGNLKKITIGNNVTSIGSGAFSHCYSLESVIIPDSVTNTGNNIFMNCENLKSVTIGKNITVIENSNFAGCNNLADVYYSGTEEEWNKITIEEDNECLTNSRIHLSSSPLNHYTATVTAPTCTSKGYTTYTCACGYNYKDNFTEAPHSYTSKVTKPATHLAEGVNTYTCSACGDTYTEAIAKIKEHTYTVYETIKPDCTNEGYTIYVCQCGDSYEGDFVSATGHSYNGDTCVNCGKSKVDNCSCNCHKTGFSGFIWKILCFFYKLFGMKQYCSCGVAHY